MSPNLLDTLQGFAERMQAVCIFNPILSLSKKQKYPQYCLQSLGFAVLLYILEHMLHSTRNCTRDAIAQFLKEVIFVSYKENISNEEASHLAKDLISELRNDGVPFSYDFYDLETAQKSSAKFSLLDYEDEDGYNIKDKTIRLKLTTEGLDLLFKTREVYQELKISITQLYLRQQIAKGVFDGALRTVQELKLQVRDLKTEIEKMKEKIRTDVQKIAKEGVYKKLVERINRQLEREREVFIDIQKLVENTLETNIRHMTTRREETIIEKITAVKRELQRVIVEHDLLFSQKLDLGALMIQSIDNSIINAFKIKLNFEREILNPFVLGQGKPDFLKTLISPLLFTKIPKLFNVNKIFQPQDLFSKKKRTEENIILDHENEAAILKEMEREKLLLEKKEKQIFFYLSEILKPLLTQDSVTMESVLEDVKSKSQENYLSMIAETHFYSTFIELHQMGHIILRFQNELDFGVVDLIPRVLTRIVETHPELRELNAFQLVVAEAPSSLPPLLQFENGYCMTNFIIEKRTEPV